MSSSQANRALARVGLLDLVQDLERFKYTPTDEEKINLANEFKKGAYAAFDHFINKVAKEVKDGVEHDLGVNRSLYISLPKLGKSGTTFSKAPLRLNTLSSSSWNVGRVADVKFSKGVFTAGFEFSPYFLVNDIDNNKITYLGAKVKGRNKWEVVVNSDVISLGFPLVLNSVVDTTDEHKLNMQAKKALAVAKRKPVKVNPSKKSGNILWLEPVSYSSGKPTFQLTAMKTREGREYQMAVTDQARTFDQVWNSISLDAMSEEILKKHLKDVLDI